MSNSTATPAATGTGQLTDKVAIITGASRGVGAELARVYAREGASVVANLQERRTSNRPQGRRHPKG